MSISIFTSENCPNCASIKNFLNERELAYEVFNITDDKAKKRELMSRGFLSVPVVLVDGDYFLTTDTEKMNMYFNK